MIEVRPARPGDGEALLVLIRSLAESHDQGSKVTATAGDIEQALFCPSPLIGCLVAEIDGLMAGSAIWHRSFSSFRGAEVMYLEDLSVLPAFRRRGVARALLRGIARVARARAVPSVHWQMMGWNHEARALYESAGAEIEDGLSSCRIHGAPLRELAE